MRKLITLIAGCLLSVACFAQTKPAVLPAWAQTAVPTTDIVQPSNSFISAGWQSSSTPPSRQYFNWVLNYSSNGIAYLIRRGISDWDTAETYIGDDIVQGSDGLMYQAQINPNIGHDPTTSPTAWSTPQTKTAPIGTVNNQIATTAFVHNGYLPLGAPVSSLSGFVSNGQVPFSAVQQWQGSLAINFGQITSFPSSVAATPSTFAVRDSSGFLFANYYFQNSPNGENQPFTQVMTTDGVDNALRKVSIQFLEASLSLPSIPGVVTPGQLATANTPPVGAADSRIATTAFANPSQSLAPLGRAMLPGGLIMQWGTVSVGASGVPVDVAIGFPERFPNAVFGVFVTTRRNVNANGQAINGSGFSSNWTPAGATITIDTSGGGTAVGTWFAIGN